MIERIFTNWKTTLVGVGILVFGLVMLYLQKITTVESLPFIGGLYGIYYKRKKKDLDDEVDRIESADKSELDNELSKFRKRQR